MERSIVLLAVAAALACAHTSIERYGLYEVEHQASSTPSNPYTSISAEAVVSRPGGAFWTIPLFWDGGAAWKLRISPDMAGKWSYRVKSSDAGLNGRQGAFECVPSSKAGGLAASSKWPGHFERQNGDPFWFLGDTAWGFFHDSKEDNHHRAQAEHYARTRAAQGFNVIHCMMLSENGDGNNNGFPFDDISTEKLNPRYWQEVDQRLAFANQQGLTVGLAIAWGDKRKQEPFAWRRFPGVTARQRYARYVAARYGAYNVYFLVSGEWHGEIRTRGNVTAEEIFREFVEIGGALQSANAHGRMTAIHPMSRHGSVREFLIAPWMSFADYQQNYRNLHANVLLSRRLRGPAVNGEYGYLLRDSNGDGQPDKDNSYSTEDMRFASWDIVTAGGYLVNGFGTTYFAGHRDPGPFDVDAAKNDEWEAQIGYITKFFAALPWWRLIPADELLHSRMPREADRTGPRNGVRPPGAAYWAMAIPGELYIIYVRGLSDPVELQFGARPRPFRVRQFNPRTGETNSLADSAPADAYSYQPPDTQDWVVTLAP
jgi:hypothetical protein